MTNKINIETTVNTDVKKAWDYYTNPEHITKWNFADPSWQCPVASNDMRVGGKYSARMEAKNGSFGFDFESVYDEVEKGERFTYTMHDRRQVTVIFNGNDSKTDIKVTFDPETQNSLEMQKNGWQAILDNFKKYAEAA